MDDTFKSQGFEHAPEALLLVSGDLALRAMNKRARHLASPPPERLDDLFVLDDTAHAALQQARSASGWVPLRARRRANAEATEPERLEACSVPHPEQRGRLLMVRIGGVPGLVNRFKAVQADLEAERQRAAAERRQRLQTEALNEALKRFAGTAAHDLIGPLASISSGLEMLRLQHEKDFNDLSHELIAEMQRVLERARGHVRGLIDHTHAINEPLVRERVDLAEVVTEVLEDLREVLDRADATVEVGALPTVHAHRSLIARVFLNLIANAAKYREPSRPLLLRVTAEAGSAGQVIRLQDNGLGLDSSKAKALFMPFQRQHGEGVTGSGLGLATCKSILQRHGWHIQAEGTPGEGASFLLDIPLGDLVPCSGKARATAAYLPPKTTVEPSGADAIQA